MRAHPTEDTASRFLPRVLPYSVGHATAHHRPPRPRDGHAGRCPRNTPPEHPLPVRRRSPPRRGPRVRKPAHRDAPHRLARRPRLPLLADLLHGVDPRRGLPAVARHAEHGSDALSREHEPERRADPRRDPARSRIHHLRDRQVAQRHGVVPAQLRVRSRRDVRGDVQPLEGADPTPPARRHALSAYPRRRVLERALRRRRDRVPRRPGSKLGRALLRLRVVHRAARSSPAALALSRAVLSESAASAGELHAAASVPQRLDGRSRREPGAVAAHPRRRRRSARRVLRHDHPHGRADRPHPRGAAAVGTGRRHDRGLHRRPRPGGRQPRTPRASRASTSTRWVRPS